MTTELHSIDELLAVMVERDASDLHLTAGSPPVIRVNGRLERLSDSRDADAGARSGRSSTGSSRPSSRRQLETRRQIDFSHSIPGPRALPRQRLLSARGRRRRLPAHPGQDQDARGARPARRGSTSSPRSRAASCSSPGRPAPASRRRSPRCSTTSTARGTSTSSRSRTRSSSCTTTARASSTSARSARTRRRSPRGFAPRCARTPT